MDGTMREVEETIANADVGVVYNEDLPTVRKLRVAQMVVGEAWDAADTADEDDSRKALIASALRAVERALRAYGATVPRNCGGSGERRPARQDPKPTIAPGVLRACAICGTVEETAGEHGHGDHHRRTICDVCWYLKRGGREEMDRGR